ncbi:MAG: Rid family hydrolase, partial [Actinomycetota bacterium]
VRAGEWPVSSGQIRIADGALVDGGFEAQFRQAMTNLQGLFEGEGSSLSAITKTTVFLTDMADYAAMNEIYLEFFGDHRPARSAVAVAQLPLGALAEIEASAHLGS